MPLSRKRSHLGGKAIETILLDINKVEFKNATLIVCFFYFFVHFSHTFSNILTVKQTHANSWQTFAWQFCLCKE